jgi:hypothetical protein
MGHGAWGLMPQASRPTPISYLTFRSNLKISV